MWRHDGRTLEGPGVVGHSRLAAGPRAGLVVTLLRGNKRADIARLAGDNDELERLSSDLVPPPDVAAILLELLNLTQTP